MTELEKLRKHVAWFRSFAAKIKTIAYESPKTSIRGDVIGVVSTYENQWPNWLDDGIESTPEE